MPIYRFEQIAINQTKKKMPTLEDTKTYIGLEHLESGSIYVKNWGSDVPIKGEKLIMHKGDVLLGKRNAYLRRAAIAPFDGIFSAHGMILNPITDVVDPDFFPLFIASDYFFDIAIKISVGSLSPTINWKDLKDIEFYLPEMDEQKRIAKIVWSAIETKEKYKNLLEKTDELVKSQFIEMFGDTISDVQNFETVSLEKIFDKPQAGEWGAEDLKGVGIPVLRTTNFTDTGHVDYSDVATRIIDAKKVAKKLIRNGDILIEKSGGSSDKPVGRVVFFDGEDRMYLNNNFTACLHLNGVYEISSLYAFYFMFINYWSGGTELYEGKTTGIHNLRLGDYLKGTFIPLAPIGLQEEFESMARQSDKSKYTYKVKGKVYVYRS